MERYVRICLVLVVVVVVVVVVVKVVVVVVSYCLLHIVNLIFLSCLLSCHLFYYYYHYPEQKDLSVLATSNYWDLYVLIKYLVEVVILILMLYFLQGRKGHSNNHHHHSHRPKDLKVNRKEYQEVKDVVEGTNGHAHGSLQYGSV